MPKGFTVRLDDDQAEELEAVAKVEGVSVAKEIRQAITTPARGAAPGRRVPSAAAPVLEDNQRILERLAE